MGFVCPRCANIGEINIGNIVWIRSFIISFTLVIFLSLSDCVTIFLVFSFLPTSGVNCVIFSLLYEVHDRGLCKVFGGFFNNFPSFCVFLKL